MSGNFDDDYRSSADVADASVSVLYADGDEAALEAVAGYVERECDRVSVWGTSDPDKALDAVTSRPWAGLVVGDDLDPTDRSRLVESASCPVVRFSAVDGSSADDSPVDSVVAKETDDSLDDLLDGVRDLATRDADETEVLAQALAQLGGDRSERISAFLVDADGGVVWSNQPFETAFRRPADELTGTDFDERVATAFGAVPDGSEDLLTLDSAGTDSGSGDAATGDEVRYFRHQRHRFPSEVGDYRLELFEEVTDRADREERVHSLEWLADHAGDGLFVVDEDGVVTFCNEAFAAMLGYGTDELVGEPATSLIAAEQVNVVRQTVAEVRDSLETGGEVELRLVGRGGEPVRTSITFATGPAVGGSFEGFVCVARDATENGRREDELAARRDELADITRADAVVHDVVGQFGSVTGRDELEEVVCEHLVELDPVTMAWIGKREGASNRIVPGTIVGEPKQYLRDVVATTSADDAKGGPVLTAVETGEPVVADDFREDEVVEQWRDLALSHGLYGLAMVPIIHGETVHGVLAVYATEPEAFTDPLVDRLSLLGDAVGFAMSAIQNRHLLQRDASIELEFRSDRGDDDYFGWLASALGCRLEAQGAVDLGEAVLQYLAVTGENAKRAVDVAVEDDEIREARVVRTEDDGGVVELRTSTSLQTQLSDAGGRLHEAVVKPAETTVVVEAPVDADVRAIHEVVRRYCSDAELVTKTESEQPSEERTGGAVATTDLTDRQREVLQAAYLAGYYAWPRDTTAEQLADSLDIASPTLHQHLRRAERNILAALFDN